MRFLEAAAAAREFAQGFVEETLPQDCLFHLHLNQSYDSNSSPEFKLFPEDSSAALAAHLKHLAADDVISTLWRDGTVPQWVNLSVVGETGTATLIEVLACGRFTADEARLYHLLREGRAPFHVLGPSLPINYVEGKRFSIYTRSTCWTEADLRRSTQHAAKVWSLELNGLSFTDELLLEELRFPSLEILEIHATRVHGPWLRALAGAPRLRVVRITCGEVGHFDLSSLPVAPLVTTASIARLPHKLVGVARLGAAFPRLTELTLRADVNVRGDAELIIPDLEHLSLTFPSPQQWVRQAPRAKGITLHYGSASDEDVARMLHPTADTLTAVGLRGTPVTDQIFATLSRIPCLEYVDLADTNVTNEALKEFAGARPKLRYYPRPAGVHRHGAV